MIVANAARVKSIGEVKIPERNARESGGKTAFPKKSVEGQVFCYLTDVQCAAVQDGGIVEDIFRFIGSLQIGVSNASNHVGVELG
jgi:hypothetical protein